MDVISGLLHLRNVLAQGPAIDKATDKSHATLIKARIEEGVSALLDDSILQHVASVWVNMQKYEEEEKMNSVCIEFEKGRLALDCLLLETTRQLNIPTLRNVDWPKVMQIVVEAYQSMVSASEQKDATGDGMSEFSYILLDKGVNLSALTGRLQLLALTCMWVCQSHQIIDLSKIVDWKALDLPWISLICTNHSYIEKIPAESLADAFLATWGGPRGLATHMSHMALFGWTIPPGVTPMTEGVVRENCAQTVLSVLMNVEHGVINLCSHNKVCYATLCRTLAIIVQSNPSVGAYVIDSGFFRLLLAAGLSSPLLALCDKLANDKYNAENIFLLLAETGLWSELVTRLTQISSRDQGDNAGIDAVVQIIKHSETAATALMRGQYSFMRQWIQGDKNPTGSVIAWRVLNAVLSWSNTKPDVLSLLNMSGSVTQATPELGDLLSSLLGTNEMVPLAQPNSLLYNNAMLLVDAFKFVPENLTNENTLTRDWELRLATLHLLIACLETGQLDERSGDKTDNQASMNGVRGRVLKMLLSNSSRGILRHVLTALTSVCASDLQGGINKHRSEMLYNKASLAQSKDIEVAAMLGLRIISLVLELQSNLLHGESNLDSMVPLDIHLRLANNSIISGVAAIAQFVNYSENTELSLEALHIVSCLANQGNTLLFLLQEEQTATSKLAKGLSRCLLMPEISPPSLTVEAKNWFGRIHHPDESRLHQKQALAVEFLAYGIERHAVSPNIVHVLLGYASSDGKLFQQAPREDFPPLLLCIFSLIKSEITLGSLAYQSKLGLQILTLFHSLLVSKHTYEITRQYLIGQEIDIVPQLVAVVKRCGPPRGPLSERDTNPIASHAVILKIAMTLLHISVQDPQTNENDGLKIVANRLLEILLLPMISGGEANERRAFGEVVNRVATRQPCLLAQLLRDVQFTKGPATTSEPIKAIRSWLQSIRQIVEVLVTSHVTSPHVLWDRLYDIMQEKQIDCPSHLDTILDILHSSLSAMTSCNDTNILAQLSRIVFTLLAHLRLKMAYQGQCHQSNSQVKAVGVDLLRYHMNSGQELSLLNQLHGLLSALISTVLVVPSVIARGRLYACIVVYLRMCGGISPEENSDAKAMKDQQYTLLKKLASGNVAIIVGQGRALIERVAQDGSNQVDKDMGANQTMAYTLLESLVQIDHRDMRSVLLNKYTKSIVDSIGEDDDDLVALIEGNNRLSNKLHVYEVRMAFLTRLAMIHEGAAYLLTQAGLIGQLCRSQALRRNPGPISDPIDLPNTGMVPPPSECIKRIQLCALRAVSAILTSYGLQSNIPLDQISGLLAKHGYLLVDGIQGDDLELQMLSSGLFVFSAYHKRCEIPIRHDMSALLAKSCYHQMELSSLSESPAIGALYRRLLANCLTYARILYTQGFIGALYPLPNGPPLTEASQGCMNVGMLLAFGRFTVARVEDLLNSMSEREGEGEGEGVGWDSLQENIGILEDIILLVQYHALHYISNDPDMDDPTRQALINSIDRMCKMAHRVLDVNLTAQPISSSHPSINRIRSDIRSLWMHKIRPMADWTASLINKA